MLRQILKILGKQKGPPGPRMNNEKIFDQKFSLKLCPLTERKGIL